MKVYREVPGTQPKQAIHMVFFSNSRFAWKQKGFTLTEIMLVIIILGVVIAVAIPIFSSNDNKKLAVAANEVVQALRYTRSEAMRTGSYYGIRIKNQQSLQVFRLDVDGTNLVQDFNVRDPVSKGQYDVNIKASSFSSGVTVAANFRYWPFGWSSPYVTFNTRGEPISGYYQFPLTSGYVVLKLNDKQITIALAPITGRVTQQ